MGAIAPKRVDRIVSSQTKKITSSNATNTNRIVNWATHPSLSKNVREFPPKCWDWHQFCECSFQCRLEELSLAQYYAKICRKTSKSEISEPPNTRPSPALVYKLGLYQYVPKERVYPTMYIYIYICMCIYIYTQVYTCIYHVCTCVYHIWMYVYVCIYIYIYK